MWKRNTHAQKHNHTCTHALTHAHSHTNTHAHKHTHTRARRHAYASTNTQARSHTQARSLTSTHTHSLTSTLTSKHAHKQAHMHAHAHTHTHAHNPRSHMHSHTGIVSDVKPNLLIPLSDSTERKRARVSHSPMQTTLNNSKYTVPLQNGCQMICMTSMSSSWDMDDHNFFFMGVL